VPQHLEGFRFTGDVDAVPEGAVAFAGEPLVRVTGLGIPGFAALHPGSPPLGSSGDHRVENGASGCQLGAEVEEEQQFMGPARFLAIRRAWVPSARAT
jgi:hypothetical protein